MAFDVSAVPARRRRTSPVRPEMNVTPLVDVVLVLLILFMVITPMLAKQFWVHVPSDSDSDRTRPTPSDERPVRVTIAADGAIRIDDEVVSAGALEGRLRRLLAARTDRTVFFDAAIEVPYGRAMEMLDRCRGAGATTIAVVTEPLADAR